MSLPPIVASETRPDRKQGMSAEDQASLHGARGRLLVALAVLGIVYGDLGTSAIYSLHAVFTVGAKPLAASPGNVLGVVSLVFWTLILVVSLKYVVFVLRIDNRGEGGIFALIALLRPWHDNVRRVRHGLILLGLIGAAMCYAGEMITPAISVLSAVEGLDVASPDMRRYVIPGTVAILVLLFSLQRLGTSRIGILFGPVMLVWFIAIGALGLHAIWQYPAIWQAVDPRLAFRFFASNGFSAFAILFAVFLVTSGAEAMYNDIGHFGCKWIRRIWFGFVLPMLLLNYFGQGAFLMQHPDAVAQPFYRLVPRFLLYPLVALATLATVIASQAAITGSFSMTRLAARLGMLPPTRVVQTSNEAAGQVYVPFINWLFLLAAIALVLLFESSDRMASTYGISVSTTMVVTSLLAFVVLREHLHWRGSAALAFLLVFLGIDLVYFGSNFLQIPHGGWFPVVVGAAFFVVMSTWRRGLELLVRRSNKEARTVAQMAHDLEAGKITRVPGTAVFLTWRREHVPPELVHHVNNDRALQETVVLLTVLTEDVPRTQGDERIQLEDLEHGFYRVLLHYGYLQQPNVPSDLGRLAAQGVPIDLADTSYFVAHQSPMSASGRLDRMSAWRDALLGLLMRNTSDPTLDYQLPTARVTDLRLRMRI